MRANALRAGMLLAVVLALMGAAAPAGAQGTWPQRPITLIVPLPAGGPVDAVGRRLADQLSRQLKQPVIVENVVGAYGTIGLNRLSRAAPDGYTLGLGATGTHVMAPMINKEITYDPLKGFTPLCIVAEYANVLVTNPALPVKTVAELVAYAKANPSKVTFASSGYGSSNHLSGELLKRMTGAPMLHVPYKGTAPGLNDVVAGNVGLMFDVVSSSLPFIESGRLRALATTGAQRNPALPDVPAMAETLPGFEVTGWFGLFAPPGLPPDVAAPLNRALAASLDAPDMRKFLTDSGYEPVTFDPDALRSQIRKDIDYWKPVVEGL
ncbi:tripartite tricarboxylate transporter substrate binding protein [Bordetella sp. BOR01]|uniref:Bug family tripartite tricarboxylate transporter substrate binding protein n=1 Tax=Bordetella sp. BOR01 TaxID=2854779 RepID=UPI001C447A27|nr:tripartite tricarboxylate transporter substrate binding protein [Bordetella sp. BOR01]MBV7486164.1 tripartite tricarboxylate transporter substrate binding protein [Bordetella sp. BOR01]